LIARLNEGKKYQQTNLGILENVLTIKDLPDYFKENTAGLKRYTDLRIEQEDLLIEGVASDKSVVERFNELEARIRGIAR